MWSVEGKDLHRWRIDYRIRDCAISPNGQKLVTISDEYQIFVYNFVTRENEYNIQTPKKTTCVSISRDSRYMLISMADSDVHLYDIETADIIRKYTGKRQGQFIIRSSFGGSDESMVVSGSEGKIFGMRP